MRFLVIGGSGFIGGHILANARLRGYATRGTQASSTVPGLVRFDLFKDRVADCFETSFWKQDQPVFGVVCASISQIEQCARDRKTSYRINVTNTINLLQDMTDFGVKPVFLSSSFVFDGTKGNYREDSPQNPISAYGRDKAEVEAFIRVNLPETLVMRLDKNISDDPQDGQMLSQWYQAMKTSQPVVCIENQVFSTTFVKDVAKGIILACEKGLSGVYHMANSESWSRKELAQRFAAHLGEKGNIFTKTQEELGFLDPRPLLSSLENNRFVQATEMQFATVDSVLQSFKQNLLIDTHA